MAENSDAIVFGGLRRDVLTVAIGDYCEKTLLGAMADVAERIEDYPGSNVDLSKVGIPVEDPAQITEVEPDFGTLVCEDDGVRDGQQHLTVRVVAELLEGRRLQLRVLHDSTPERP